MYFITQVNHFGYEICQSSDSLQDLAEQLSIYFMFRDSIYADPDRLSSLTQAFRSDLKLNNRVKLPNFSCRRRKLRV